MRKVLFFSLLIGMIGLVSCGRRGLDSDSVPTTPVSTDLLPSEARTTLDAIKGYDVASSVKFAFPTDRGSLFESRLLSKMRTAATILEIEFDMNGIWTDIEAENGHISLEVIMRLRHFPRRIAEYIEKNPLLVEEIERKSYGFKVETVEDAKYFFDKRGNLIGNNEPKDPVVNVDETITRAALSFVNAHFPGYRIVRTNTERENGALHHKFYLQKGYNEGYKLEYRTPDTLVEIEGDEDWRLFIPESALRAFLPRPAINHLVNRKLLALVSNVELDKNVYKVEAGRYDLKFSYTGELLEEEIDD